MATKVKEPPTAVSTFVVINSAAPNDNVTPFLARMSHSHSTSGVKSAPLEEVYNFIKEIREADCEHDIIANKYLALYDKDTKFIIKVKQVKKFLPNVNIKAEKKLLELFGVTPTMAVHPKNPKDMLYFFSPHQYILTTMINSVSYASVEERIEFAFKMYDNDGDGRISKADLKAMFTLYGKENAFRIDNNSLEAITNVIYKSMTPNDGDLITLGEFRAFFQSERAKSIKINVFERRKAKTYFSMAPGASMKENKRQGNGILQKIGRCFSSVGNLMQKSYGKLMWIFLWGIGMIYFFLSTFLYYFHELGVGPGLAKGAAKVVDYNMAIMILLATKSFTTAIRAIGLRRMLPVNINVYLHTRIGYTTFIAAWVHSLAHLTNVLPTLASLSLTQLNDVLFTPQTQTEPYLWWVFRSVPGWTGIVSLVILTLLIIMAIKPFRQKNYERFWYTHALWFPLIILLCFHGIKRYLAEPQYYKWIAGPAFILVLEKFWVLTLYFRKQFTFLDMNYLDSEVVELKVSKPHNFKFIPGQYALLKINELSRLQWHPFSFSCSQDEDYLSFHISPVGDWTRDLKKLAQDFKANKIKHTPNIYIRGPFGAPSQHYTEYKHIMIISSGIGATPFSSIMRHINHKAKEDPDTDRSVEFYWVNKKPSSYVWLTTLFRDIQANESVKGLIKINMFFTSPHEKYDLRSILLWKGLEILYAENVKVAGMEHFDLMKWGRPEWGDIFTAKALEIGKGRVGVFFCGNDALAKELHDTCVRKSGDVVFKFYKEIF